MDEHEDDEDEHQIEEFRARLETSRRTNDSLNQMLQSKDMQVLILSPTREFATQTERVMQAIGQFLSMNVHACVGGKSIGEDIRKLEDGVHVVSGTPGWVCDMIREGPCARGPSRSYFWVDSGDGIVLARTEAGGVGESLWQSFPWCFLMIIVYMVIQEIFLLDTLDKEGQFLFHKNEAITPLPHKPIHVLSSWMMLVVVQIFDYWLTIMQEWYGWHFPELLKIVNDNYLYAKLAKFVVSDLSEKDIPVLADLIGDDEKPLFRN